MKPSWEWAEADLLDLIRNQVQESIELDYKRSEALQKTDGKRSEISKDVSAMANSVGGTIVYGIIEDKHIPTGLDMGLDPFDISREWLEQVINSSIQRRIDGIKISEIALPSKGSANVAFAVYIPQSPRAPHQAADKKFYKRFNFQSVPMEEYEIRDIAGRPNRTALELRVTGGDYRESTGSGRERNAETQLQFEILNTSAAIASFAVITAAFGPLVSVSAGGTEWEWVDKEGDQRIARCVIASGSSRAWTPITPGFTLFAPKLAIKFAMFEEDRVEPRAVAAARLDHEGGTEMYRVVFWESAEAQGRLHLEPGLTRLPKPLAELLKESPLFNATELG